MCAAVPRSWAAGPLSVHAPLHPGQVWLETTGRYISPIAFFILSTIGFGVDIRSLTYFFDRVAGDRIDLELADLGGPRTSEASCCSRSATECSLPTAVALRVSPLEIRTGSRRRSQESRMTPTGANTCGPAESLQGQVNTLSGRLQRTE